MVVALLPPEVGQNFFLFVDINIGFIT